MGSEEYDRKLRILTLSTHGSTIMRFKTIDNTQDVEEDEKGGKGGSCEQREEAIGREDGEGK